MAPPTDSPEDWLGRLCDPAAAHPVPSVMLVLAHPDDETVGAASLLPRLSLATFVYVTDGSPRDLHDARAAGCATRGEYAALRRGELISALDSVGVPAFRLEFIGDVDQEAYRHLVPLTRWLEILMREHAPAMVLTHPYEGGHPDHDATAFAVHAARRRILAAEGEAPALAEFTSYHGRDGQWEWGEFLAGGDAEAVTCPFGARERTRKRRLLGCFASQRGVLERVPLAPEKYRLAPGYDFSRPPHPGTLLYEQFNWGVTGAAWRRHATAALERLGLASGAGARHHRAASLASQS